MKVKYSKILEIKESCNKLKTIKMPIKTAYKISKILQNAEQELSFFLEEYKKIVESYAERDENGNFIYTAADKNNIRIMPEKQTEAIKVLTDLENLDIEFPDILISLEELGSVEISPDVVAGIAIFIKE